MVTTTNQTLHGFNAGIGRIRPGLLIPQLAVVEQATPTSELKVVKTGRGLLFGSPRGEVEVDGVKYFKLLAPRTETGFGDEARAIFEDVDAGAPRVVKNEVSGRDVAFEGSVIKIGPRKYSITARKEGDGSHLIHVRTGVPRAKGEKYADAISRFLDETKSAQVGLHGSYALDADVEQAATVEEYLKHLLPEAHVKWNVARTAFEREDGLAVPAVREDAWLVPEGCSLVVVDPTYGAGGHQQSFRIRIENGKPVVYQGGKAVYEQFKALEIDRRRQRDQEKKARLAAKAAQGEKPASE